MGVIFSLVLLIIITYWLRNEGVKKPQTLNRYYKLGVGFRVVGTLAYITYAFYFSGGGVDAWVYDNYAAEFANYFRKGDFSPFTDPNLWRNNQLFYTNFVAYPAAFFMIVTLNSTFGIYLLFSIVCFAGLVFLFYSFTKNYTFLNRQKILLLLMTFPALWFWTSTIGKDAFMFLGIGVLCLGITDKKINYLLVLTGLGILYAFRPPTAYVSILALGSFFVLNFRDSAFLKGVKIVAGAIIIFGMANYLADLWGIQEFSNDELIELQQGVLRNSNYGTGALEEKEGGLSSIPQGLLDVLARPFIWEVNNPLTLASAFEINFVLLLLFIKRKSVFHFIKNGLNHRLSTFSLSFVFIYVTTVGIFENNIGLIARHRIIIFPFLFLMAFAYDDSVRKAYFRFLRQKKAQKVYATSQGSSVR